MTAIRPSAQRPLVASTRPAAPAVRPAVAVRALAPRVESRMAALTQQARALGASGLPEFKTADEYKVYAIRTVGYVRYAEDQLRKAQANGGERAVNDASYELNQARTEIRRLQRAVGGFKAFHWGLPKWLGGQGFKVKNFWESQQVDSKMMIVKPPAPEPITALKSPAIDAANAALQAVGAGNWTGAETSFSQAIQLARTPEEALLIGQAAAKIRFHLSANFAFTRGADLATTRDGAMNIALEAAKSKHYRYDAAEYGFKRAADVSKTKAEALEVSNKATEAGFPDAASYAFHKASALS